MHLAVVSALILSLASSAPVEFDSSQTSTLKYITLEEHFDSPAILSYQEEEAVYDLYVDNFPAAEVSALRDTLSNLTVRIPDMNNNDIRIQVRHSLHN